MGLTADGLLRGAPKGPLTAWRREAVAMCAPGLSLIPVPGR